jgi:hypothetical protein
MITALTFDIAYDEVFSHFRRVKKLRRGRSPERDGQRARARGDVQQTGINADK